MPSSSAGRLSVAQANLRSVTSNAENIFRPDLKRNMKLRFKLHDSDECKSVTLVSRAGKAKEKYRKVWYSQFADRSVKPVDFEEDVAEFQSITEPTKSNVVSRKMEGQPNNVKEEIRSADTSISEIEKEKFNAK